MIKPSYFSVKIISVDLHQELEINLEESCKEDLPKMSHEKLLYGHTLWNVFGSLLILIIAYFRCTKDVFREPEDHQGSIQIPKQQKGYFCALVWASTVRGEGEMLASVMSKPNF